MSLSACSGRAVVSELRLADMTTFGLELRRSKDIDPVYPVLKCLSDHLEWSESDAIWACYVYLTYYNLASAYAALEIGSTPQNMSVALNDRDCVETLKRLPTGIERRGLRGGNVIPHIATAAYSFEVHPYSEWFGVVAETFGDPKERFRIVTNEVQQMPGNGRWAAFKWADLLKNVVGYPIAAPDLMLDQATGPLDGIRYVFGNPTATPAYITKFGMDYTVRERLVLAAMDAGERPFDWEETETVLCNYHSLAKGRYYIGHDIDEMQEVIRTAQRRGDLTVLQAMDLMRARRDALPYGYRGEKNGWEGIQKERLTHYRTTGELLWRDSEGRTGLL